MVDMEKEMKKLRKSEKNKLMKGKILRKPKVHIKTISASGLLKSFASGNRKLVRDEVDVEEEIKMERIRWI